MASHWPWSSLLPNLSASQSAVHSAMRSSSDGAVKAKEGDIETGDAASELQKKIQNDSNFTKLIFIPKLRVLLRNSKIDENNSKKDAPIKLKRSNSILGGIVKFISDLPDWLKYALAALAWIMYPLYQRLRKKEDEMQDSVQSLLQVVERVAQVTEKLATDIAEALPCRNNLKGAVETVGQIALKVEKDAETAQAFVKMVDDLGDDIDEYLNPILTIGDAFMNKKIEDKKEKKEDNNQLEHALDAKL